MMLNPRQRLKSKTCGCTFETVFSDIYGKHGSFKEYLICCKDKA